jgi:hypothetical protein
MMTGYDRPLGVGVAVAAGLAAMSVPEPAWLQIAMVIIAGLGAALAAL